ncbi:MAG: hypothetical protein ACYS4W_12300 [Planctomycetota bacterium]
MQPKKLLRGGSKQHEQEKLGALMIEVAPKTNMASGSVSGNLSSGHFALACPDSVWGDAESIPYSLDSRFRGDAIARYWLFRERLAKI